MQQNMILLVVVGVVIVIGIVAAVFLLGQPAAPVPTTGNEPGTAPPDTTTPPDNTTPPDTETPNTAPPDTEPPILDIPPTTGGTVDVDEEVLTALSEGTPVTCTSISQLGTMFAKIEDKKVRLEISSPGGDTVLLTADGITKYMNIPELGDQWYMDVANESGDTDPSAELRAMLEEVELPPGNSISCEITGDIPDSEFEVPAGAEVVDAEQLLTDLYGDVDPALFEQ